MSACPAMNTETADDILGHHNGLRSWRQPFMFVTREGLVDLSLAVGDKAATQPNVSHYQPDGYPNWPKCHPVYRFDLSKSHCGTVDETKLFNNVKQSLVGVNFFLDNKYDTCLYRFVRLVCSFLKTVSNTNVLQGRMFHESWY